MFHRIVVPVVLTSLVVACGSATNPYSPPQVDPGTTPTSSAQVSATPSLAFTPATVALNVGGTVTFAFGSVGHNVFFDNDPAGAPASVDGVNANASVQRSFPVAGVYNYYCHIHPGMRGTIVVGTADDGTRDSTRYGGYDRRP